MACPKRAEPFLDKRLAVFQNLKSSEKSVVASEKNTGARHRPGPCMILIGMIAELSVVPGEGAGFQLLDQSIMDFRFSATVMGAAVAAFT